MLSTVVIRLPERACRMPSIWEARKSGFNSFFRCIWEKQLLNYESFTIATAPHTKEKSLCSLHTSIFSSGRVYGGDKTNLKLIVAYPRVLLREKVDLHGVPVSSCVLVGSLVTLCVISCVLAIHVFWCRLAGNACECIRNKCISAVVLLDFFTGWLEFFAF